MEIVPVQFESLFKKAFCFVGHGVFQGTIVDTDIHGRKGESGSVSAHLARSDAIFEEVSRIEHMRVPYHQDI
jgi:hypothetical protein